jgi:hypothetical protein
MNQFVRLFLFYFILFLFLSKVISIECFEKIRHAQKIFPLKSVKGYKCIYNELERKGSLPYIEQKRAASSSPNVRKAPPPPFPPPSPPRSNNANSPSNSPKNLSKTNDQQTSATQKSVISYSLRQSEERQRQTRLHESSVTPLRTNQSIPSDNDPLVMKYQTIQRYRTNFEILKPSTVIAEEWENLDRNQKNRLSVGGSKSLVLISKCSRQNKSIEPLPT